MFVGRTYERAWLEEAWPPTEPTLRVIYGHRRLGKSALIDEFVRGKRHIMYQAVEGSIADQLRDLSVSMRSNDSREMSEDAPFATWAEVFEQFSFLADQGPIVIVLDEYQYLAESDPGLTGRIQEWWNNAVGDRPIYLILCGSNVRFFEQNALAEPDVAGNAGTLKMLPLSYRDLAGFFPSWGPEELVRTYAMLGGVPYYLEQLEPTESLVWNIEHRILVRGAVLYREAEILLREELRELRTYFSIMRSLGDGCTRTSEIAERLQPGGSRSDPSPYLHRLRDLGLVDHITPITGDSRRRGKWRIVDPYLRFWFRFVVPYQSLIEHRALPEGFFASEIAPQFDHVLSRPAFADICMSWLLRQISIGGLDVEADSVGSWWGPIPNSSAESPRGQTEASVDAIALADGMVVLAGDATWSSRPVGTPVLQHLQDVVRHIPGADESTQLVLFGRAFDADLIAAARAAQVRLVSAAQLFD